MMRYIRGPFTALVAVMLAGGMITFGGVIMAKRTLDHITHILETRIK